MTKNGQASDFGLSLIAAQEMERITAVAKTFWDMSSRFDGFSSPNYSQAQWESISQQLIALEKDIIFLESLSYLYGYIARALLNAQNLTRAKTYANAGLELNTEIKDREGIESNYSVLVDMAVFNKDYKAALELINDSSKTYSPHVLQYISEQAAAITKRQKTRSAYLTPSRPASFRYALGQERETEKRIRLMQALLPDCSRAEAKRYVKTADLIQYQDAEFGQILVDGEF